MGVIEGQSRPKSTLVSWSKDYGISWKEVSLDKKYLLVSTRSWSDISSLLLDQINLESHMKDRLPYLMMIKWDARESWKDASYRYHFDLEGSVCLVVLSNEKPPQAT